MTDPKFSTAIPNPFEHYEKPNPFLVQAMPATPVGSESRQEWGAFSLPETVDDDVAPSDSDDQALEILITWGSSVLHVAHLSPPRSFVVGEGSPKDGVDFFLAEEVLGRKRLPLVEVTDGSVMVVLPEEARGDLRDDESRLGLDEVLAQARVFSGAERARKCMLLDKARLTMQLGEVKINVRLVKKAAPIERGLGAGFDWAAPSYFAMTAGTIGAFMGALAYFVPPLGLADEATLDKERLVLISQYLDAASEREEKRQEVPEAESGAEESGATGKQAPGPEGEAGKDDAPRVNKRVAVAGPRDNPQLELSREQAMHEARTFGFIGMLSSAQASDPLAPTSIFGADRTLGADDLSADGNMWGDAIGESGGRGGLGLMGDGFGGGDLMGDGLGIGLGRVGTIGPGLGKEGFGRSNALATGTHQTGSPQIRTLGTTITNGRIPPQVVQRIVRQNFGRFRMCYQQGLARNPGLEGRIPVRFVIGRDGGVSNVAAQGGFPDSGVTSCVQSAFYGLSFPPPDGGIVTVTYPLLFSPS